jgi:hypothetical protein
MTTRAESKRIIVGTLYGFPGEDYDTDEGRVLATTLLMEMGLEALTDEACSRLAALHQQHEDRATRALLQKGLDP